MIAQYVCREAIYGCNQIGLVPIEGLPVASPICPLHDSPMLLAGFQVVEADDDTPDKMRDDYANALRLLQRFEYLPYGATIARRVVDGEWVTDPEVVAELAGHLAEHRCPVCTWPQRGHSGPGRYKGIAGGPNTHEQGCSMYAVLHGLDAPRIAGDSLPPEHPLRLASERKDPMGEMRVLNQKGDVKVEWDADDAESVKKAKAEFTQLKKDGYRFYEVAETRGKQVDRFDKKLGKLIAAPGARSEADKRTGARPRAMAGGPNARTAVLR